MKKTILAFICLSLCTGCAKVALRSEAESTKMLPPILAQGYGPGGTIIMWHDTDNDVQVDRKATYVFKDGRLHQVAKEKASQKELGFFIRR